MAPHHWAGPWRVDPDPIYLRGVTVIWCNLCLKETIPVSIIISIYKYIDIYTNYTCIQKYSYILYLYACQCATYSIYYTSKRGIHKIGSGRNFAKLTNNWVCKIEIFLQHFSNPFTPFRAYIKPPACLTFSCILLGFSCIFLGFSCIARIILYIARIFLIIARIFLHC